jgi:hypothetical protein
MTITERRHKKFGLSALALLAIFCWFPWVNGATLAQDAPAGTVTRVKGAAIAVQNAEPRVLGSGANILIGDIISTGPGARLEIAMVDGGAVTLGERTVFVVIDYAFSGADGNAVFRLMEGAALAVTGRIASLGPDRMRLETEGATIGIRGTTLWGGALDGRLQFILLDGSALTVENRFGRVILANPGEGTQIPENAAPAPPGQWPADKLDRAKRTVSFD